MVKGLSGRPRPNDAIGLAVCIGRIVVGECNDEPTELSELEESSSRGGRQRTANLTAERLSEIGRLGAERRWQRPRPATTCHGRAK